MSKRRHYARPDLKLLYNWYQVLLQDQPRIIELPDRKMAVHVRHRLYYIRTYDRETFVAVHGGDDAFPLKYLGISLVEKTLKIDWDVIVQALMVPKPVINAAKAWEDCQIRISRREEAELAKRGLTGVNYADLTFSDDPLPRKRSRN